MYWGSAYVRHLVCDLGALCTNFYLPSNPAQFKFSREFLPVIVLRECSIPFPLQIVLQLLSFKKKTRRIFYCLVFLFSSECPALALLRSESGGHHVTFSPRILTLDVLPSPTSVATTSAQLSACRDRNGQWSVIRFAFRDVRNKMHLSTCYAEEVTLVPWR